MANRIPVKNKYWLDDPIQDVPNRVHFVYFIKSTSYVKIGYSQLVRDRLMNIQASNPHKCSLIKLIECESKREAIEMERTLHVRFDNCKHRGEWFKLKGELKEYIFG